MSENIYERISDKLQERHRRDNFLLSLFLEMNKQSIQALKKQRTVNPSKIFVQDTFLRKKLLKSNRFTFVNSFQEADYLMTYSEQAAQGFTLHLWKLNDVETFSMRQNDEEEVEEIEEFLHKNV